MLWWSDCHTYSGNKTLHLSSVSIQSPPELTMVVMLLWKHYYGAGSYRQRRCRCKAAGIKIEIGKDGHVRKESLETWSRENRDGVNWINSIMNTTLLNQSQLFKDERKQFILYAEASILKNLKVTTMKRGIDQITSQKKSKGSLFSAINLLVWMSSISHCSDFLSFELPSSFSLFHLTSVTNSCLIQILVSNLYC